MSSTSTLTIHSDVDQQCPFGFSPLIPDANEDNNGTLLCSKCLRPHSSHTGNKTTTFFDSLKLVSKAKKKKKERELQRSSQIRGLDDKDDEKSTHGERPRPVMKSESLRDRWRNRASKNSLSVEQCSVSGDSTSGNKTEFPPKRRRKLLGIPWRSAPTTPRSNSPTRVSLDSSASMVRPEQTPIREYPEVVRVTCKYSKTPTLQSPILSRSHRRNGREGGEVERPCHQGINKEKENQVQTQEIQRIEVFATLPRPKKRDPGKPNIANIPNFLRQATPNDFQAILNEISSRSGSKPQIECTRNVDSSKEEKLLLQKIEELNKRIEVLEHELRFKESLIVAREDEKMKLLESKVSQAEEKCEKLQAENEKLKKDLLELQEEIKEAGDEFRHTDPAEWRKMTRDLQLMKKSCRNLQIKLRQTQSLNLRLKAENHELSDLSEHRQQSVERMRLLILWSAVFFTGFRLWKQIHQGSS